MALTWKKAPVPIGGGGFLTGVRQSKLGDRLIATMDVCTPVIRDKGDARWRWLFTPDTMPANEFEPFVPGISANDGAQGCAAACMAPSDKDRIYGLFNDHMMKAVDGRKFVRTNLGQFYAPSNTGAQRLANNLLDVHPTNEDVLLFGTHHYQKDVSKSGVFYSLDAGESPAIKVQGISPAFDHGGNPGRYLVAIDQADPDCCYAHSSGVGLYGSRTGLAGPYTFLGGPTMCSHLLVTLSGTVLMATGGLAYGMTAANDLYRLARGSTTFTSYTTSAASGAWTVAAMPSDEAVIAVMDADGVTAVTRDGGASWEFSVWWNNNWKVGDGETLWMSNRKGTLFPSNLMFDNVTPYDVILAQGLGISKATVPAIKGQTLTLHDFSAGFEEKVASGFVSSPGKAQAVVSDWDYAVCKLNSLTEWSNLPQNPPLPGGGNGLSLGADLDNAAEDPSFLVCAIGQSPYSNAFSPDYGDTWETIFGQGTDWGVGGAIACNRTTEIGILETNNGGGHCTGDGGKNWNSIQLVPGTDTKGFIPAQYVRRHSITADKTSPGTFALVYKTVSADEQRLDNPLGGMWLTRDAGKTWAHVITGLIGGAADGRDGRQYWDCRLEYIPDVPGELLYTGHCDDIFTDDRLFWIKDNGRGGVVPIGANVTNVSYFDFGVRKAGQVYPPVAFEGRVNGIKGLYFSEDWFATDPVLVDRHPMDNLSSVKIVGCDRTKYGRIYTGAIGWNFWDLVSPVPAPPPPPPPPPPPSPTPAPPPPPPSPSPPSPAPSPAPRPHSVPHPKPSPKPRPSPVKPVKPVKTKSFIGRLFKCC